MKSLRKCHNCNGKGYVSAGNHTAKCLYCKGKGYRDSYYGVDKTNGEEYAGKK